MATTHTRLSYHPFLSNFFNDELIMRLEARYGCIGSYFVIYIRCMLYDNGYYLKCDKEIVSIICRKLCGEISTETALEIIDFLLDNAFFDKEIYQKHGILTSLEIQQIWITATKRRKRDLEALPYLIVNMEDTPQKEKEKNSKAKKRKQHANTNSKNACINEQIKTNKTNQNKEKKDIPPLIPPTGEMVMDEEDFSLDLRTEDEIPIYAHNPQTHNYAGLCERMKQFKITNPKTIRRITHLTNWGEKGTKVWQVLAHTNWSGINDKAAFLISELIKDKQASPS